MAEDGGDLSGNLQNAAKGAGNGAAGAAGKAAGLAASGLIPDGVNQVISIVGLIWMVAKPFIKIFVVLLVVLSVFIFMMFMSLVEPVAADDGGSCSGPYTATTDGKANPSVVSAIWGVLDAKGADSKVILATFETGLVESGLRNLANTTIAYSMTLPHDGTGSDHDSVGVFQQRASGNWGGGPPNSESNIKNEMTPAYAAQKFIEGAMSKEKTTPGSAGALAQAVQVSAVPDAYDARQNDAQAYINSHGGSSTTNNSTAGGQGSDAAAAADDAATTCTSGGAAVLCASGNSGCVVTVAPSTGPRAGTKYKVSLPVDANNQLTEAGKAVQAALGVVADKIPYVSPGTSGFEAPTQASGMDCSGLTRYSVYVGTGGRIQLSHHAASQTTEAHVSKVTAGTMTPGDLIETDGGDHIIMYIGNMKKGSDGVWASTTDGSGTPMYAAEPYSGRTADIGPVSNFAGNIVNYGHPDYK